MSDWDSQPFLDFDPDAREQATAASRERVREGFTQLIDSLQRPLNAAAEARSQAIRARTQRRNAKIGVSDRHVVQEGCSIPVSPALLEKLGTDLSRAS